MTQSYKIALALTVAALTVPAAFAGYVDVTIADPHRDKSFGTQHGEDNEVEDNAVANQSWDLESFKFDSENSRLKITAGFNFETGQGYNGTKLWDPVHPMGDIFLYIGKPPYTVPSDIDHDGPWGGSLDWTYAISFVRDSNDNIEVIGNSVQYVITAKTGTATVETPGGAGLLNKGLPWLADNPTGEVRTATYSAPDVPQTASNYGSWVNEISNIDLSSILASIAGETVYAHTTMQCGNDVMWGQFQPVPDGGTTLVLLGSGLVGLAFFRRRIA